MAKINSLNSSGFLGLWKSMKYRGAYNASNMPWRDLRYSKIELYGMG